MIEFLKDFAYLNMVEIPAGKFLMGSPPEEKGRYNDEGPQHEVTLEAFLMSRTLITQAQWRAVASLPKVKQGLDHDPSYFKGDDLPVEQVSWLDALEFCARLSQHSGRNYTLPSEAQWEYACRAGTTTRFFTGDTITTNQANFDGAFVPGHSDQEMYRYRGETTTVGMFPANAWGLYDMHGNVWEWCLDDWHDSYEGAPTDGSAWIEGNRLGKSVAAEPGHLSPGAAALPTDLFSPNIIGQASSDSAFVAEDDSTENDSLGKSSEGDRGLAIARMTADQRAAASIPNGSAVMRLDSASALEANSLGKSSAAARGCSSPSSAARHSGSDSTRLAASTVLGSASASTLKLLRGGSWFNGPRSCRSAYRFSFHPALRLFNVGFRVCCLHGEVLP